MKCDCCGAEIVRIDTMGGPVVCWAPYTHYWPVRDEYARELLTSNGETVHGNMTGDIREAVGLAYLPHTCHQLPVILKGLDSWDRPVYEDPSGRLLVDVDPRKDHGPDICNPFSPCSFTLSVFPDTERNRQKITFNILCIFYFILSKIS